MESEGPNRNRQIIITLAVLIVISVIVAAAVIASKSESTVRNTENTTSQSSTDESIARNATYKDGTYSVEGGYNSPGGAETITIEVTLADGVITDTTAEPGATNAEAELHQADFIGAYKEFVVGQKIDNLSLNRVAGASLTTRGFNNALEQIKDEAQI